MDERPIITQNKAIVGIMAMASVMMFSLLFTITLLVFAWVSPIENRPDLMDYLSQSRVISAAVISGLATALFWTFID